MRFLCVAALAALALGAFPAAAQNLSLRAPLWAQPLVATDVTPTTGGRLLLEGEGIVTAVRVTIMPTRGGVARVIRYDARADGAQIALRRFTGHPSTGWWLWGSDAPSTLQVPTARQREIAAIARELVGVAGSLGEPGEVCQAGEQAFVEVAAEGRALAFTRACAVSGDLAGRLALILSELAGSRTEEELAAAALDELMSADRAFAAMAAARGVPAAFEHYAAPDALVIAGGNVTSGRDGIVQRYANWPEGARLEWAPEAGRVSARGDMGWTWGNSIYVAPDGARTPGRYVSVWTRDYEGNWRYAFDAAIE
jgi:ketosteroid isomerase-like protein